MFLFVMIDCEDIESDVGVCLLHGFKMITFRLYGHVLSLTLSMSLCTAHVLVVD